MKPPIKLVTFVSSLTFISCSVVQPPQSGAVHAIHSKPKKIPASHLSTGKSSRMELDELYQLQQSDGALIYDVRLPYFFNIDHIPGAINWPHTAYSDQVETRDLEIQKALKSGKKIVIYCFNMGCSEARNVAHKLARRDYQVWVLGPGVDAWRAAGLPLD